MFVRNRSSVRGCVCVWEKPKQCERSCACLGENRSSVRGCVCVWEKPKQCERSCVCLGETEAV